MREGPRKISDSPEKQYEALLAQGIAVQKEYEAIGKRIEKLYDAGKENEAEELSEQRGSLEQRMTYFLGERVEMIRKVEKLTTIEDVFPRAKKQTKEEKVEIDAADLIRQFNAGRVGTEELRAAARKMQGNTEDELTKEEWSAFVKARVALATTMGYKTSKEGAEDAGNWLDLSRNGVKLSMKHFAVRSHYGITGDDRISKMDAVVKKGKESEMVLNYDRGWDVACTDPKVQKEIDRAIAIFG